ncbi:MAG: ATP-binding cassette domain-containing protein [Phycisphaera sp.]|nr:ATP-binding cassette domain-containing protein [Phycisphaera sp.]
MSDNQTPLLKLEGVCFHYGDDPGDDGLVLNGVDLVVEAGESMAIVGPSGSGKSTLLNIIGTLDRPTAGHVWLEGQDLATLDDKQLAAIRNTRIGFIFQSHHLLPQCTVLENVLIPTLVRGTTPDDDTRARRLLERVGLSDRLDHRPGALSGGQRQRVAVVRALINQPALLLADEPTGSLDHAASVNLADLLVELNREEGVTLITVTHAVDLAERMARRFELRDARLATTNA